MNREIVQKSTLNNLLHTLVILASMALLIGLIGWLIGGVAGVVLAGSLAAFAFTRNPYVSTVFLLRRSKARPLQPHHFPELYQLVRNLAGRAGLSHQPILYSIPSAIPNAFVVGREDDSSIVISESLLRSFSLREIAGILGHEIAHIRNKDLLVMSIAGVSVQITQVLSTVGQIGLLFALPAVFLGEMQIALLPFMLLVFAPTLSMLLQLALSRTREFEADLVGVQLCGDVYGLASALQKLEGYRRSLWQRFLSGPWRGNQAQILQTHPATEVRIARLLALTKSDKKQQYLSWPRRTAAQHLL